MNRDKYTSTQAVILTIGGLIVPLPLAEFLAAIEQAQIVGPVLDPTLYRAAGHNLTLVKRVARLLRSVQLELEKIAVELEKSEREQPA